MSHINGSFMHNINHWLKGFSFFAIVLASLAVVSVSWYPGEQSSLTDRNILQWSWWVQACQTLAFYNQSSLKRHFQPHQPWMLISSLLGVLVAVSATCVDRIVFFLLGWGGWEEAFIFFLLSMEKELSAQGRRCVFWKEKQSKELFSMVP